MKKKDLKGKLRLATEKVSMLQGIKGGLDLGTLNCETGPVLCPFSPKTGPIGHPPTENGTL